MFTQSVKAKYKIIMSKNEVRIEILCFLTQTVFFSSKISFYRFITLLQLMCCTLLSTEEETKIVIKG
jgi:hypothetical protein